MPVLVTGKNIMIAQKQIQPGLSQKLYLKARLLEEVLFLLDHMDPVGKANREETLDTTPSPMQPEIPQEWYVTLA